MEVLMEILRVENLTKIYGKNETIKWYDGFTFRAQLETIKRVLHEDY